MDQQKASTKSKNKILKFLPRATSSVSFQNPQVYSPAVKDKRSSEKTHKSNLGIGFSGPMVSMIPADTRRKIKNDYTVVYEPTSPRVSCMGTVKCKYQREKLQRQRDRQRQGHGHGGAAASKPQPTVVKSSEKVSRSTSSSSARTHHVDDDREEASKTKKKMFGFKKLFGGGTPSGSGGGGGGGGGRKGDGGDKRLTAPLYLDKAPSLGTMKRFSSGRDKFADIDWTKEVAAMESDHRRYFSDEESDDDEVIMPSSAPVVMRNHSVDDNFIRVGGVNLEPRKEINLWKRRTMAQPKPLQLHGN